MSRPPFLNGDARSIFLCRFLPMGLVSFSDTSFSVFWRKFSIAVVVRHRRVCLVYFKSGIRSEISWRVGTRYRHFLCFQWLFPLKDLHAVSESVANPLFSEDFGIFGEVVFSNSWMWFSWAVTLEFVMLYWQSGPFSFLRWLTRASIFLTVLPSSACQSRMISSLFATLIRNE